MNGRGLLMGGATAMIALAGCTGPTDGLVVAQVGGEVAPVPLTMMSVNAAASSAVPRIQPMAQVMALGGFGFGQADASMYPEFATFLSN